MSQPLDYLVAEHDCLRSLCGILEHLADADDMDLADVDAALAYLRNDWPLHLADESEDLFPLLLRRCKPADEVKPLVAQLDAEHGTQVRLGRRVISGLAARVASRRPGGAPPGLRSLLTRFAQRERRHLAVETGILIPIARARLRAADRSRLTQHMAKRRAIPLPPARGKTIGDNGKAESRS